MAKKSKKSKHKIAKDIDGTYYCTSCGEAGYHNTQSAYGHLRWCKGFKSVQKKALKEYADTMPREESGLADLFFRANTHEKGETLPSSFLFGNYPQKEGDALGPEALPEAPSNVTQRELYLTHELAKVRQANEKIAKYAFNHLQHIQPKNYTAIRSPNDLLFAGFSDLTQDARFRKLLTLGVLVFLGITAIKWLKKNLKELED